MYWTGDRSVPHYTKVLLAKISLKNIIVGLVSWRPLLWLLETNFKISCHVYFMRGLCDLTYRDTYTEFIDYMKQRVHMHEKVSFTEDNRNAVVRVTNLMDNMDTEIRSSEAKPWFMTIPPYSIEVWNLHRLNTRRTTHLITTEPFKTCKPISSPSSQK